MRQLVIIGAGGFGREVLEWARAASACGREWEIKGFLDDAPGCSLKGTIGAPLLGTVSDYRAGAEDVFVCAIGVPKLRRQFQTRFAGQGRVFVSIVHPSATICRTAVLGAGVVVCPYALVSADAMVEDGSVIYYHTSIDHDARVGRWSQISGHCDIAGGGEIGSEVFIGSHAVVLPGIKVGDRAVIGAGAVVTRDVAPGDTVTGVPARPQAHGGNAVAAGARTIESQ